MQDPDSPREKPPMRGLAPPCALVIFGATGDLTRRKLLPALYNLAHEGRLPDSFAIVGFARSARSDDAFRRELLEAVDQCSRFSPVNSTVWNNLARRIYFCQGQYDDPASYQALAARLAAVDQAHGTAGGRLFYMATPPSEFSAIAPHLGAARLLQRPTAGSNRLPSQRVVVEKPIGHSLTTARALNVLLARHFDETQILRIDHYLGKETVQNILVLRFANEIFEPLWNAKYVDHVQITVAESDGVGGRGGYYDGAGALRDMLQNHMMGCDQK